MNLRTALLSLFCSAVFLLPATGQDTLTIVAYNILNYPSQNSTRYNDLKQIVAYLKPDLMIVSELESNSGASTLLSNAFNTGSVNYYARANFVDGPDTDNMLFYNTQKLSLASQDQVSTSLRDISHYHVYACGGADTVWLDVFSAHLKAGNNTSDATDRYNESVSLCNYLSTLPSTANIIVGGDFNLYGIATEPAWTQLTSTCSKPLFDPISSAGEWHANIAYKNIHTQSTRSSTNPGCCSGTTGGMDDRFDFLLINNNLKQGLQNAKYLGGSYKAVGNDGNHYNKAIIESPTNTAVPSNIVTALFNMSDHLPVMMKVIYSCNGDLPVEPVSPDENFSLYFPDPQTLVVQSQGFTTGPIDIRILSTSGATLARYQHQMISGQNTYTCPLPELMPGMYMVCIQTNDGMSVRKFIR